MLHEPLRPRNRTISTTRQGSGQCLIAAWARVVSRRVADRQRARVALRSPSTSFPARYFVKIAPLVERDGVV